MKKDIALIFIGTSKYADFFPAWKKKVDENFLCECDKTIFAFTDRVEEKYFQQKDVQVIQQDHLEWPFITLFRFNMMLRISHLKEFDYVFFLDADLFPEIPIKLEDITSPSKVLMGVQHPGNLLDPTWETLERREESTAHVTGEITEHGTTVYHQGCLWGGTGPAVMQMCLTLAQNVLEDQRNQIVAIWHDESHMNKYFLDNIENVYTVDAGYAWPEAYGEVSDFEIKMIHQEKPHKDFPRFRGVNPEDKG